MSRNLNNFRKGYEGFKWNNRSIDLLSWGYLRKNFDVYLEDIATILFHYIGKTSNLIIETEFDTTYPYTAVSTPFVVRSLSITSTKANNQQEEAEAKPEEKQNNMKIQNPEFMQSNKTDMMYIFGGYNINATRLNQLHCNMNTIGFDVLKDPQTLSKVMYFGNKYIYSRMINLNSNKFEWIRYEPENHNLAGMGIRRGNTLLTFFIGDHSKHYNCICVINLNTAVGSQGYNIYSIEKDEWILENNIQDVFNNAVPDFEMDNDAGAIARLLLLDQSFVCVFDD